MEAMESTRTLFIRVAVRRLHTSVTVHYNETTLGIYDQTIWTAIVR